MRRQRSERVGGSAIPAGYVEHMMPWTDIPDPCLILPEKIAEELTAQEWTRRQLKQEEAEKAVLARYASVESHSRPAASMERMRGDAKRTKELKEEEEHWAELDESENGGSLQRRIFSAGEPLKLYRLIMRADTQERQRLEQVYANLRSRGYCRRIAAPDMAAIERLKVDHPHMSEVVDFVANHLKLAGVSAVPGRVPPLLLIGGPGIGKTHFAQALAAALRSTLRVQRLDTDVTGACFLGSERKWSNAQHGLVFESVALGEWANPVVLLDEIDKSDRACNRPAQGLFSLLEPTSATCVRDIAMDFEFDASLVTWIATANDALLLDAPLRSRFREFHIKTPDTRQSVALAERVMASTIERMAITSLEANVGRLHVLLAHLTPREVAQVTEDAVARALARGATRLERRDLPSDILREAGIEVAASVLH